MIHYEVALGVLVLLAVFRALGAIGNLLDGPDPD